MGGGPEAKRLKLLVAAPLFKDSGLAALEEMIACAVEGPADTFKFIQSKKNPKEQAALGMNSEARICIPKKPPALVFA